MTPKNVILEIIQLCHAAYASRFQLLMREFKGGVLEDFARLYALYVRMKAGELQSLYAALQTATGARRHRAWLQRVRCEKTTKLQ